MIIKKYSFLYNSYQCISFIYRTETVHKHKLFVTDDEPYLSTFKCINLSYYHGNEKYGRLCYVTDRKMQSSAAVCIFYGRGCEIFTRMWSLIKGLYNIIKIAYKYWINESDRSTCLFPVLLTSRPIRRVWLTDRSTNRQTNQQINQQTNRGTWRFIGALHFQWGKIA